jgi:hypothetical protein
MNRAASRRARRRPIRVTGDCPPDTVCLRCHQPSDIKGVVLVRKVTQ